MHHADLPGRARGRATQQDLVGDRNFFALAGAGDRDRIERQRAFASQHQAIVRRGIPREDLIGHRVFVEGFGEFQRLERALRFEAGLSGLILFGAAKREQDRSQRHAAVEFVRHADAHRNAVLVLDLATAIADRFPGVGYHADVGPQVAAVVHRIRDVAVGKPEVFFRHRVVGALERNVERLAEFLFALDKDIAVIDDIVFIRGRWAQEHAQIVALILGDFGGGAALDAGHADIGDDDLCVVFVAPLFHESLVEPFIEGRHEVVPLHDLERAARCRLRR